MMWYCKLSNFGEIKMNNVVDYIVITGACLEKIEIPNDIEWSIA